MSLISDRGLEGLELSAINCRNVGVVVKQERLRTVQRITPFAIAI